MIFLAILAFIFGLGLIVCIHEFGHFVFAKRAGILCYEFSIGMGPAIYKKKKGETTYAIRAIPIGGYVSMAGEQIADSVIKVGQKIGLNFSDDKVSEIIVDENGSAEVFGEVVAFDLYDSMGNGLFIQLNNEDQEKVYSVLEDAVYVVTNPMGKEVRTQIAPYNRSFESKKLLPRFLSISFGPIMNFLLAIVLYFIVGLAVGKVDYSKTVISEVSGPAATIVNDETKETILMKNDEILSIEGVTVSNWNELSKRLDETIGFDSINMTVKRKDKEMTVKINPIVFIGNFGVCGYTSDDTSKGLPLYLYVTNAKKAGIKDGDLLKTVDGIKIESWPQLVTYCNNISQGKKIEVVVDRPLLDDQMKYTYDENGNLQYEEQNKKITVDFFGDDVLKGVGIEKISQKVGISPSTKFDFFHAVSYGFTGTWDALVNIFNTIGLMFSSNQVGVSDLSGPVGIYGLIENTVSQGIIPYISLLAMLSVNIGLINLLPIPALDGGRLVFLAYEAITRKKPNRKLEATLNTVVFILLMFFFVYITFNDIIRLG